MYLLMVHITPEWNGWVLYILVIAEFATTVIKFAKYTANSSTEMIHKVF